jgi:hypothetical protein
VFIFSIFPLIPIFPKILVVVVVVVVVGGGRFLPWWSDSQGSMLLRSVVTDLSDYTVS